MCRTLNDAAAAVDTHTSVCDSMTQLLTSSTDRLSKMSTLPLTHAACEPLAVDLLTLKSDQHKLTQLLDECENSTAGLESLCGDRAASKHRQRCDGMFYLMYSLSKINKTLTKIFYPDASEIGWMESNETWT